MFQKGGAEEKSDEEKQSDFSDNPFAMDDVRGDRAFGRGQTGGQQNKGNTQDNPIYNNKLPLDARFTYVASYNNSNRQSEITNHSLMFSGNIQLSPKWEVGFNSGYDLKNKGFADTRFAFKRDLGSFRLSFDWTPFGRYERWYFFIGIKSSLLSDIKWENRSQR